jgi:hypothetical protein
LLLTRTFVPYSQALQQPTARDHGHFRPPLRRRPAERAARSARLHPEAACLRPLRQRRQRGLPVCLAGAVRQGVDEPAQGRTRHLLRGTGRCAAACGCAAAIALPGRSTTPDARRARLEPPQDRRDRRGAGAVRPRRPAHATPRRGDRRHARRVTVRAAAAAGGADRGGQEGGGAAAQRAQRGDGGGTGAGGSGRRACSRRGEADRARREARVRAGARLATSARDAGGATGHGRAARGG